MIQLFTSIKTLMSTRVDSLTTPPLFQVQDGDDMFLALVQLVISLIL